MEVHPLTEGRFGDLEALFGPNGAVSGCWCMYWRIPGQAWENRPANHDDLELRVASEGPAPGLLAYDGGRPVGWVAVAPRPEFPRVLQHRNLGPGADDDPADERVWSLNCFYIAADHRRQGVAGQLVAAAVAHAERWGARGIEAYPVDRSSSASGDLYTGTPGLFTRAGFSEVRRRHPSRPVFRLDLPG